MITLFKTILLSSIFFLASLSNGLFAQCDSYAGTMQQGAVIFCLDFPQQMPTSYLWIDINSDYSNNPVLDANDTLLFFFTDIDGPINGEIIGSAGAGENIPLPPGSIDIGIDYRLYAVVGNNNGNGGIDFTDTCLSISGSWGVNYELFPDDIMNMSVSYQEMACDGEIVLDATEFVLGFPEFYFYQWNTGENTPQITITEPGRYSVDIWSGLDYCISSNAFDISPYVPMVFNFDPVDSISCVEDTTLLRITPVGTLGSWTGKWLDQLNNTIAIDVLETFINTPGIYYFEITFLDGIDENCTETYEVTVPASTEGCIVIQGTIGRDKNNNCAYDIGEPGLVNRLLQFESPTTSRLALTDADGNYQLYYPANIDADISIVSTHFLYQNCQTSWMVSGVGVGDTIISNATQSTIEECPLLEVQLSAGITRRCFSVPFDVSFCNRGNLPAENAYIVITLDEHFLLGSSDLAYTDLGNNEYQFDLGTVVEDDCDNFKIYTTLSCDVTLGETVCSEAHIYPDTPCPSPNPAWSEASVSVTGSCDGSENKFIISNVGTQDMIDAGNFNVIEDGVMLFQTPEDFILNSGAVNELSYPANGKTYRVEATQVAAHPGMSMPSFTIEGCGGFGSTGYVNQFSQNDLDPFIDIECRVAIGSYDPNDKTAFPTGYSNEHFIKATQEIEYLINFQNTGTDTAFTVMVQDVIDPNLDITTFQPKSASHDYSVVFLENDTIQFIFNNILLPDSTTNLIGSNGYIRFTISPEPDVTLGTVITNNAAIFFDFNEAIITNEVIHTIGENFIVITDVNTISSISPEVEAYPNPTNGEWFLFVKNVEEYGTLNLVLTDALGRSIVEKVVDKEDVHIDISSFSSGVYFWKLENGEGVVGSGRLLRM